MRTIFGRRTLGFAVVLGFAGLQTAPVAAAVTVYTDQAAFDAAIAGAATYGFTGFAPIGGIIVTSPTVAGVTFSSNNIPFVIDDGATPTYGVPFFSGQGNTPNDPPNAVSVSLSGHKAFGFRYGSYYWPSESYSVTLNTGEVFDLTTSDPSGAPLFLGFVSDDELTGIELVSTSGLNVDSSTGHGYAFDIIDFTLDQSSLTSAVPEPGSWTLMVVGLGMLGAAMRRPTRVTVTAG